MISMRLADAVNKQINAELYSAYLYLSMQTWFDSVNLPGCSNWMRVQAMEEFTHTDRLWRHLVEQGARVTMTAIDAPQTEWTSPLAVFEAVYAHEQKVTGLINALVEVANEEKDAATIDALKWFVDEQGEEEESADAVVRKVKKLGDAEEGMSAVDRELGERAFKPPVKSTE